VVSLAANVGENLVQVSDLAVTYISERTAPVHALDGVSFEVRAGEAIGILGESGSGKSTLGLALLRLLPDYARYERGTIHFDGQDLLALPESGLGKIRGARIAHIPQDPALALNPVMRVGVQIAEVLRAHAELTKASRRGRVEELLREVGFDDPAQIGSAYPHQLSGGQRQRVVIAQAIACRPSLVIADEPTSKLDAALQAEVIALLAQIRRRHQMAFLMISHDPAVLADFSDRIFVMYAGQIVEKGNVADIFRDPLHPYTQGLVGLSKEWANRFDASGRRLLPTLSGDPPDLSCASTACRFEPCCRERMEICANSVPADLLPRPSHHVSCFKYEQ
jgi:peptide/nickel transport system ATP-binding protein